MTEFEDLLGKTLTECYRRGDDEEIIFTTECGKSYKLHHNQDCCEHVYIEDICGDLEDLVGSPLLLAEESTEDVRGNDDGWGDIEMWTFYKLSTNKGSVTIRWNGSSNGYYSVGVDFTETT